MRNEEYINTVIERAERLLPLMKLKLGDSVEGYSEYFKMSLRNMAEWKDQQFKEYLEKKMVELSSRGVEVGVVPVICQRFIMEIINELFGGK